MEAPPIFGHPGRSAPSRIDEDLIYDLVNLVARKILLPSTGEEMEFAVCSPV